MHAASECTFIESAKAFAASQGKRPKSLAFTFRSAEILVCRLLLVHLRTLLYTATILISFSGAQAMCKAASKDKKVDAKLYTSSYFLTKR